MVRLTGRIYVEEKKSWRSVTDKFESGKKINPDSTRPCLQVVENNFRSNIMALLVLWRLTARLCGIVGNQNNVGVKKKISPGAVAELL